MPLFSITPPNPDNRLHGLDHLRAMAILFVFMYHYGHIFPSPEWLAGLSKFGWTGVDLFFVLSGYLISSQLFATIAAGKKISFKTFFLKRFFRIVPAYLVVVGLYFLFPVVRERESPAPLWKYLTFTQNLGLDLRTQGTFSHAWSLCIEEQFYILLPLALLALLHARLLHKGRWVLLLLVLGGFALRWYVFDTRVAPFENGDGSWAIWYKWLYYPTYSRLDGLLCGVSIAALFRFKPMYKDWLTGHGHFLLLLGVFVLTGAYIICFNEMSFDASVFGFPLVSLGYGLLLIGALSRASFLYRLQSVVTSRLAALSYAIYLTHKIIIHLTQDRFAAWNVSRDSILMLLICCVSCFCGALLLNILVEKPFLDLRNRLLRK